MLKFSQYLTEKAGEAMNGSFGNSKGRSHVKAYILPFLSAEQKKGVAKNLSSNFREDEIDTENNGELHNPENEYTHEIVSKTGHKDPVTGEIHPTGTKVKITGLKKTEDNRIIAQTENHGEVPVSKLGKPEGIARKAITAEGFKLEAQLQKNADPRFKPAGSTGESYDFVAGDPKSDMSIKGKAVKKDESSTPYFRGESKTSKRGTVAMGTITLNHNKDKGWSFAVGKSKMQPVLENVTHPESGLKIIDHLNREYPDGNLKKGFSLKALPGTAAHYIRTLGANSLHLHRYAKNDDGSYSMNHGTTYTVGESNPFIGKLGMAHLSEGDLNSLDGTLQFEKSGDGKVQIKHRPSPTVFNKLADASLNDEENHVDLSKDHHGDRFREAYQNVVEGLRQIDPELKSLRKNKADSVHGGVSFYNPEEQKHLSEGPN